MFANVLGRVVLILTVPVSADCGDHGWAPAAAAGARTFHRGTITSVRAADVRTEDCAQPRQAPPEQPVPTPNRPCVPARHPNT